MTNIVRLWQVTHRIDSIRASHLCPERFAAKKGIQQGLEKRKIQVCVRHHSQYVNDTHIRVDATNGDGEHAIETRVWENKKSNQIAHGEDPGEESGLNGTTNESIEN